MERKEIEEVESYLIESINKREPLSKDNLQKADLIGFKNFPDKIIETDQYGFIKEDKK
jgi:hypothetical protein